MVERDQKTVQSDEIAFFSDYYAEQSYNLTGWRLRLNRELRFLRQIMGVEKPSRVLSVGCGDGAFEVLLSPFVGHITALDISPQAIDVAQKNARDAGVNNIDFKCMPLAELNWSDQFDVIICLAFLHHVRESDLPNFLHDCYKHLRPNGFFYSQDPNVRGVLRKVGRVILGSNYDKYHSPDERELDPTELNTLLQAAGFSLVKIGYIDLILIPLQYIFAKRPSWPLYLSVGIDWIWCHSPLACWASGFNALAYKNS